MEEKQKTPEKKDTKDATTTEPSPEKEPVRTEKEPTSTEKEPSRTEKEPARTDKELYITEKEPSRTDSEPSRTEKDSPKTDKEHSRTEKEVRTEKDSPRTGNHVEKDVIKAKSRPSSIISDSSVEQKRTEDAKKYARTNSVEKAVVAIENRSREERRERSRERQREESKSKEVNAVEVRPISVSCLFFWKVSVLQVTVHSSRYLLLYC